MISKHLSLSVITGRVTLYRSPLFATRSLRPSSAVCVGSQLRRVATAAASTRTDPRMETTTGRPVPTEVVGRSGKRYIIEKVVQDKESPLGRVYLARIGSQKFVIKDIIPSNYKILEEIYGTLHDSPHVRVPLDAVPEQSMFIYKYFTHHLLAAVQEDLPLAVTKQILKDALRGLAAMHDRDIVHTDVKANNIMVDFRQEVDQLVPEQVQFADLEDAAIVSPGKTINGLQLGNIMWRSPEAHASRRVNKPSDIFSFGIVCIYAVLKRVIFAVAEEELEEGVDPLAIVIERQISYFADPPGMVGFAHYLGEKCPWFPIFAVTFDGFGKENPREPFSLWQGVDETFKDLIGGLTNFDPAKRLTAREALEHCWFKSL